MKFYFSVLLFVLTFSCTAEQKPLKEFIYGEFVMDADASRKFLETIDRVQELKPDEKKGYLKAVTEVAPERFLTVKKNEIIVVDKAFIDHYEWKILKEEGKIILIEIKPTFSINKKTKKKYLENKPAQKMKFSFFDKDKKLLQLVDEHKNWYKIWKKK